MLSKYNKVFYTFTFGGWSDVASVLWPVRGTRATETMCSTVLYLLMLFLPMMIRSSCCRILKATCFLAIWFVANIAMRRADTSSHGGTATTKKKRTNIETRITKTIEKLRLKNGMLMTTYPGAQRGVTSSGEAGGRMICAQISEVIMARAVIPTKKMKVANNIFASMSFSMFTQRNSLWKSPQGS